MLFGSYFTFLALTFPQFQIHTPPHTFTHNRSLSLISTIFSPTFYSAPDWPLALFPPLRPAAHSPRARAGSELTATAVDRFAHVLLCVLLLPASNARRCLCLPIQRLLRPILWALALRRRGALPARRQLSGPFQ